MNSNHSKVVNLRFSYHALAQLMDSGEPMSVIVSSDRVPGWGAVTADKLAPVMAKSPVAGEPAAARPVIPQPHAGRREQQTGRTEDEESTGVKFKSARETLMESYGCSPEQIATVLDPFDESRDDWYEVAKRQAVRYKEAHGTVRTRHMLAVGAGVQSLQELRFVTDGSKRAAAFIALLDADLLVREALGKGLDVKLTNDDGLTEI